MVLRTKTRGGRRLEAIVVVALLAVTALVGADAVGASSATPSPTSTSTPTPTPTPTPTLVTRVLQGVRVRNGASGTVKYRVDGDGSGDPAEIVTVTLVVETLSGKAIRTLVRDLATQVGVVRRWHGRLLIPAGRYLLVAHAVDASGQPEARAVAAWLRMLKALPAVVPSRAALRRAFGWASRRLGRVAVAVVDSRGKLHGLHPWRPFMSASVVKAMLLVAYLRGHRTVRPGIGDVLRRMIDYSDNAAADLVYGVVGRRGLGRLAHTAGMRHFGLTGAWITTRITAADMAFFFRDMERYIPARHRRLANRLLAGITPSQRWGIPAAAGPLGYHVYFKGGWLGAFILANQAARLERGHARLGLAVLTDGNPSSSYGPDTIRGVAKRLLSR